MTSKHYVALDNVAITIIVIAITIIIAFIQKVYKSIITITSHDIGVAPSQ